VGWIDLAQDSYRWCPLVKSVMKFQVPHNTGDSGLDEE